MLLSFKVFPVTAFTTAFFFPGYDNQDWFIPSPALQVDEADLKLSPDQIRETLNYFRTYYRIFAIFLNLT